MPKVYQSRPIMTLLADGACWYHCSYYKDTGESLINEKPESCADCPPHRKCVSQQLKEAWEKEDEKGK